MNLKKDHPLARTILQGLTILVMLAAMAGTVSPALAATIPVNDNFNKAVKITTNSFSASIADMTAATSDPNDPILTCDGGGQGEATLWYTFTPSSSGELSVKTTYSKYDTILTVFKADASNDISSLIEIGCNDNAGALQTSSMSIALRGGI